MKRMDRVLLLDGLNQMWRANMSWGKKEESSSVEEENYVMINNFFINTRALVEKFSPNKIFLVLEGHPKHRHALYSEYKANRIIKTAEKKAKSDKFYKDANEIIRLGKMLPITFCKAENYECDDVINTLCEDLQNEDITVITNDSDYIQILQMGYKNCKVYNPIKKSYMQAPIYPYVAYKALVGDKSDNIPRLVSEAKAEKMLTDPIQFKKWMSEEENRANFNLNFNLIKFVNIPKEELLIEDGETNFSQLRSEFINMKFEKLTKEETWRKFCSTFLSVK